MTKDQLYQHLRGEHHGLSETQKSRLLQLLGKFGDREIINVGDWEIIVDDGIPKLKVTVVFS